MKRLNTKTGAILMMISFVIWQMLVKFFPLAFKLIDYALSLLFAFSIVLFVIAVLTGSEVVSMVAHYWCSFCLPVFAIQLLAIDYLTQFVAIEDFIWVFLVYWFMLPFIISGLALYSNLVWKRMELRKGSGKLFR